MIPAQVYYAMPYVLAFLLALAIPVGVALQYRLTRSVSPELRIAILFSVIAAGALLTVALIPRNLDERELETAGRQLMTDFDDGFAASRYLTLFLVGAGFVEMLRGWIDSRSAPVVDPARPVLFGLVAFDVFGYVEQRTQVDTLTGRRQIGDITLQAWHESVLFGYGRETWGRNGC